MMKRVSIGLFVLWLSVLSARADNLATPPPAWEGRLQALAAMDLSAVSEGDRAVMADQRTTVDRLLADKGVDTTQLAEAWGRLGALFQAHDQHGAAAISFDNAGVLEPGRFRWAYYRAWVSLSLGDNALGLRLLERAEAIKPGYVPSRLRKADALLALGEMDAAVELYTGLADAGGLAAAAAFGLGRIALSRRDWATAETHLRRTLDLDPEASRARYSLALALRGLGRSAAAREQLAQRGTRMPRVRDPLIDALRELSDPSLRHFQRGMAAIREHDYGAAVRHFAAGLEEDPDNARARTTHGRALYLDGAPNRAREALEQALKRDPDALLPRFLLGVLMADKARGLEYIDQVLRRAPDHEGALLWRANAAMRGAEFARAARLFGAVTERGTDMSAVYLQHWVALRRAGANADVQARAIDKGLARKPGDPLLRFARLRLHAEQGPRSLPASELLEQAEALAGAFPAPGHDLFLARALALNGRYDDAARLARAVNEMMGGFGPPGLARDLEAYERGESLAPEIAPDDPLMFVPPADPRGPFRNYPDPRPF